MEPQGEPSGLHRQIVERLIRGGFDPAKAAADLDWLIKALHPAWTRTCGSIPDHSLVPSITPDYVVQHTLSCPAAIAAGGNNWDALIFQPPGDVTAAVMVAAIAGVNWETAGQSANGGADGGVVGPVFLRTQGFSLASLQRGFNVYTSATSGNFPTAAYTWVPEIQANASRLRYKSLTVYPVASDLYNQGTIYAGNFARARARGADFGKWGFGTQLVGAPPAGFLTSALYTSQQMVTVPFDEANMSLLDPSAVGWPFRNGAYIPGRWMNPSIDWTPRPMLQSSSVFYGTDTAALPAQQRVGGLSGTFTPTPVCDQVVFMVSNPGGNPAFLPVPWLNDSLQAATGAIPYEAYETSTYDMAIPVVIVRGMAPPASLTIRCFVGPEYTPDLTSPALQFSKTPVAPAPQVMALYYAILSELGRTVYPSSFNSFATILQSIGNVVKRILPVVGPVVGSLFAGPKREVVAAVEPPRAGPSGRMHAAPVPQRLSTVPRRRAVVTLVAKRGPAKPKRKKRLVRA